MMVLLGLLRPEADLVGLRPAPLPRSRAKPEPVGLGQAAKGGPENILYRASVGGYNGKVPMYLLRGGPAERYLSVTCSRQQTGGDKGRQGASKPWTSWPDSGHSVLQSCIVFLPQLPSPWEFRWSPAMNYPGEIESSLPLRVDTAACEGLHMEADWGNAPGPASACGANLGCRVRQVTSKPKPLTKDRSLVMLRFGAAYPLANSRSAAVCSSSTLYFGIADSV